MKQDSCSKKSIFPLLQELHSVALSAGMAMLLFVLLMTGCRDHADVTISVSTIEPPPQHSIPLVSVVIQNKSRTGFPYSGISNLFAGEIILACDEKSQRLRHREIHALLLTTSFIPDEKVLPAGGELTYVLDLERDFVTADQLDTSPDWIKNTGARACFVRAKPFLNKDLVSVSVPML